MKVSFILPIYKVEQYLNQCVESIIAQTYTDYEILLVDDGSPDNCPKMCDEWEKKDNRIKALHKSNGGLSDARNYGLDHALGEYVVFVDSDDFWMKKDSLQKLVDLLENDRELDFVGFNCSYYYQTTDSYVAWAKYDEELGKRIDNNKAICLLNSNSSFNMSAWSKIIKRSILTDNKLYFKKGQVSEDIQWFINLLEKSRFCKFVNEYVTAYRQGNTSSITHNIGLRNIDTLIEIVESEIKMMPLRNFAQEAKNSLFSFLAYEYSIILGYLYLLDPETASIKYEYLKKYSWLLDYTQDPKVKKVAIVNKLIGLKLTTKLLQYKIKRMVN